MAKRPRKGTKKRRSVAASNRRLVKAIMAQTEKMDALREEIFRLSDQLKRSGVGY